MARVISIGTSAAMLVEIAYTALQSFRRTTSHFNDGTPFDGAVFGLMGFMILFSSVLVGVLLYKEDRFMQVLGARRRCAPCTRQRALITVVSLSGR